MSLARRLFTLSGVVPLGAFLVLHAIANATALRGEAAFLRAASSGERVPGLLAVEVLLVYVPLLFHAAFGAWLVATRTPLAEPSPYPGRWRLAVRATGVAGAVFLFFHLPELRFRAPGARPSGGLLLTWLTADLSSTFHGWPLVAVGYLFGSACTTFHFAAGTWGAFAASRLGASEARVRRGSAWGAAIAGFALWLAFADTVVLHATGARLFGDYAGESGGAGDAAKCPP